MINSTAIDDLGYGVVGCGVCFLGPSRCFSDDARLGMSRVELLASLRVFEDIAAGAGTCRGNSVGIWRPA